MKLVHIARCDPKFSRMEAEPSGRKTATKSTVTECQAGQTHVRTSHTRPERSSAGCEYYVVLTRGRGQTKSRGWTGCWFI